MSDLPDIQAQADSRGIPLHRVGVSGVELPITFAGQPTHGTFEVAVMLPHNKKGVHMSRFIEQLRAVGDWDTDVASVLRTMCAQHESDYAEISLEATVFRDVAAPVTGEVAPAAVQLSLTALCIEDVCQSDVTIGVVVANCCPCSKDIAEYGAHNQRVALTATVALEDNVDVWELIKKLEQSGSAPVYPILKRVDEKMVTETQYDNPKFTEDVTRDAVIALQTYPGIRVRQVRAEALESIHPHNAFAEYVAD